jgi:LysM repeat protein
MASTYKVVKGDTLSAIAKRYGMTLAQLRKLNPQIANPNVIKVGQVVNVSAATPGTTDPAAAVADEATTESGTIGGGITDSQNAARLEAEGKNANLANATAFGLTAALIAAFPELKAVYDKFLAGDKTQAEIDYYATNYYKNMTDTAQSRSTKKATRPGVYAQELEAYVVAQRSRLAVEGIADVSNETLETAYLSGWTDKQLDLNALGKVTKALTGDTLGDAQALKQYADAYGMSYNAMTYDIWTKALFAGTTSIEDMKNKIRQDSASAFPVFADQINAGKSLDSLASAYKSSIANILEKDPDTVSWTDPNLRKALQNVDKDGKPILMPIWQFEKNLRSTTEWEYTNNARDTMDSLSLKVLRDWGLA